MSLASDLAAELTTRLSAITVANGYSTDVGLNVYRGKRRLAPEDVPLVVILEGEDRVDGRTRHTVKLGQKYSVEAHMVCADPDNPNDTAHLMLADLKKAIFTGDATFDRRVAELNYTGRGIGAREDGTDIVFATVDFELVFSEDLRNP
jgi:hypothetical protein